MIDEPRPVKEEEYDDLMRLLERSYGKIREFFQDNFPHVWKKENVQFENHFVIKKDEKIVSHVGLMPLNLVVDGRIVKAGGIGGVGTDPDFRSSGFMSELLKYTIVKMKESGFPISVLWGDRQRYGSYGWESSCTDLTTILTKRNLQKLNLTQKIDIKKYSGDSKDLQKIIGIHEEEPLYVQRDEKTYKMSFARPEQEVWLGQGEEGWAYLVISGEGKERFIKERGGNPEVFLTLASEILEKIHSENLRIVQPNRLTPLTGILFKVCALILIGPLGMVKILDLDSVLKQFGVDTCGIKFKMTAEPENKFQPINLSGNEIVLPEQAMVRLLFGPLKPSRNFNVEPGLAKTLDSLFPLDFYVWPLDHI